MPPFQENTYPPPQRMHGVAERFVDHLRLWRQRRRWIAEIANAAAIGRLETMLDDLGLTRAELDFLIDAPADAGQQFEELARLEGVDLNTLSPEVRREATWKCIRCPLRAPCKRWLQTGSWDADGDQRCPNAALLSQ